MRKVLIALLTVGALAVPVPSGALEARASRSTVHRDADDDVRVIRMGDSEVSAVGDFDGDLRRVVTRVGRWRVRVAVTFDAMWAAERLTLRLNFAARKVSRWRGHIAQLTGSRATGVPERSFLSFRPGDVEPEPASCPGLRTIVDPGRWVFSVPTSCLAQTRPVRYQEVSLQTEYAYDDAYAYDTWPRRGAVKIR